MKKLVALLLALSTILSLSACGGSKSTSDTTATTTEETTSEATAETASSEPQYGGSATFYYPELMNYFDPAMADNRNYSLWLEGLWTIDWGSESPETYNSNYITYEGLSGQIADSWTWDDQAGVLTVKIRQDVYFQTKDDAQYDIFKGRQVTAADVKYSYDRLLGLDGVTAVESEIPWFILMPTLASVAVVDDYTVAFTLNSNTETTLSDFMITPVNITGPEWDTLSDTQKTDFHYACGTGPYILQDFVADNYMKFVKNDNYYDYDERYPENKLPYIDEVTLTQIADSSNVLTQFISGQLDYFGWHSDVLNSSEMQQLRESMDAGSFVEYTYANTPVGIGLKTNVEPFNDVNVRIAMQMAINSEEINSGYYGITDPLNIPGLWSDSLTGWTVTPSDETMATYAYNPEKAKELLTEAGYPNGFEFTVILTPSADLDLYTLVQSYFAAVGITMKIENVASNPELNAAITVESDTRCFFSGVGGQYNMSQALNRYSTGGHDYALFHGDTEFDSLAASLSTATTLDERAQYASQMDAIWRDAHWCLYVGGTIYLHDFVSARIGGFTGERVIENINIRPITARIWVTDGK